jgi:hypothetical protein
LVAAIGEEAIGGDAIFFSRNDSHPVDLDAGWIDLATGGPR